MKRILKSSSCAWIGEAVPEEKMVKGVVSKDRNRFRGGSIRRIAGVLVLLVSLAMFSETPASDAACGCKTCRSFAQALLASHRAYRAEQNGISDFEIQVVDAINGYRQSAGLRALTIDAPQCPSARTHCQRMASWGRLVHASGYMECIATIGGNPDQVARLWMNSPPHRAILMAPNRTRIAIGRFGPWHTARVF